jgi:hypothetical protein
VPNWFKKKDEELPPELKDKTPEEMVRYIKVAEELGEKVKTLTEERAQEKEQVVALSSQFDQVKQKLASTEANLNKLQNPPRTEEPADFLTEPEKAVDQRVAPLANLTVQNAFMTARILAQQTLDNQDMASPLDAKTMDGRLYRAWEGEINAEAAKYPQSSMIRPDNWIGIYYLVKGRHADELANPEKRKKNYNFLESGSQQVHHQEEKKKDGVEALTDQQKHVADKMGVSYENYAKRLKGMTIIPG